MTSRDSSSFMIIRIDGTDPAINPEPSLRYSNSGNNLLWSNASSYSWASGINSTFPVYQKHSVAIFCNNTNTVTSYDYLGIKSLNPQSYDVYLDSVLDVNNMFDNFFGLNRLINSFMFAGSDATCANGGPYLGDTLIVDNIRWTSDFTLFSLPVHLSSFTATLVNENSIILNWRDETPEDNVTFDVQWSNDAINFRSAGQITESANLKDYSFPCNYLGCGKLFFRLEYPQKGQKVYSEVRTVDIPCNISIIASIQAIQIDTKYAGNIELFSSSGQVLMRRKLGYGHLEIPVSVPPGIYFARFIDVNGKLFTQKLFIR